MSPIISPLSCGPICNGDSCLQQDPLATSAADAATPKHEKNKKNEKN